MKTLIRLMLVSLFVFIPNSAQATDEVVKSYCAYLIEYNSLEELKDAILVKAKVLAVNELFGEVIRASTTVENFIVTNDQIQSTTVGFIRIKGDVAYYNGSSLAEVCVRITAYVTQEDRREFQVYVDSLEPQQQATPTPTRRRSTATPTSTPNRTATRLARPTQTAAARATIVQITVEAIQEATRVQQEVDAQLTRLAPAALPTPQATNTPIPTPQPVHTPTPAGPRVEIITDDLNIRSGPGTGYDRVGKVSTGQVLIPVGRDGANTWIQVCCINGQPGWVVNNAEYVVVSGDLSQLPVITPPTPTPLPLPVACSIAVDAELAGRWNRDEMGCPTGPAQTIWSSYTPFERGFMMWRRDTDAAYGFYSNGGWKQVADRWDGSSPAPSRGSPPPGLTVPTRGTGYVWGSDDELFHNLGWARGQQTGLCSRVQSFEKGFILRSSSTDRCHEEHQNPIRDPNFLFIEAYYTSYWRR